MRQIFWATAGKLDAKGANEAKDAAERHEDLTFSKAGVTLNFIWDPFLNASALHQEIAAHRAALGFREQRGINGSDTASGAALLLIGGGLWHAQHTGEDSLKSFKDSLDTILWMTKHSEHGVSNQQTSPLFHTRPTPDDRMIFAPVQVPWYDSLSPYHAASLTEANINPLNEYLRDLSKKQGILVAMSHFFMTWQRKAAYKEDGLHVVEIVARRKADVLLNMRCNAELSRMTKYPMDKTCCSDYTGMNWVHLIVTLISMWILLSLTWIISESTFTTS